MQRVEPNKRCINLDWLEVYALEPSNESPHDAEYFRSVGLIVKEREYGTRVYKEMFTIYGSDNLPLLEVRRNPMSASGRVSNGVLDEHATHIRLCNRTCYCDDAAEIMESFLHTYHYELKRISRLDIALDFEYFDSGDDPQKFLNRYINGKYAKINQSRISLHGLDCWDGRYWNSVKWGSPKSMVNTKMYDKTMELRENYDKPYIRQAWFESGLISDWHTMEKTRDDGTTYKPRIWRVEFSIKSHDKNWFQVEDPFKSTGNIRSIRHTLDKYFTRSQMCDVFFSLCAHYFAFKKIVYINDGKNGEEKKLQRKDRCPDKILWDVSSMTEVYIIRTQATSDKAKSDKDRLLQMLYEYQREEINPKIQKALYTLIERLEEKTHNQDFSSRLDEETIAKMRKLVSERMERAKIKRREEREREGELYDTTELN